jgi:hypothetical protein
METAQTLEQAKTLNKEAREQAVIMFKQKALGKDFDSHEVTLRGSMAARYKHLKSSLMYKVQTEVEVQFLEQMNAVKMHLFPSFAAFLEDLTKRKKEFLETSPWFASRDAVIAEIMEKLIIRGSENFAMSNKHEND